MDEKILNVLCCPKDNGVLEIEKGNGSNGYLKCRKCSQIYPITNGIPILLPENHDQQTKEAFSVEWDELKDELPWGDDPEKRIKNVFESLRMNHDDLKDKYYLDIGCGDGSKITALTNYCDNLFAIDITSAMMKSHKTHGDKVHFIQTDFQFPPFYSKTFDVLWAGGTIHHTPNPEQTFLALAKLLKPNGIFYVWLYKKGNGSKFEKFKHKLVRRSNQNIQSVLITLLATWGYFAQEVRIKIGKFNGQRQTYRQLKHGMRDHYTVPYYWNYEPEEIKNWFKKAGLELIYLDSSKQLRALGKR